MKESLFSCRLRIEIKLTLNSTPYLLAFAKPDFGLITSRKRKVKNVQDLKIWADSANLFYTKNPWNQQGVDKTKYY